MATPNVGILTNAGKNLIDQVNAGQTKITFSKIVFSSMNNNQLTDDQIKALTTVAPQEIVVNNPKVTLDNNTGETRIRATGNNEKLDDGVYVKTYGVFAKDDTGNEILYGLTVSPNPNYLPEYDGVTPQAVTYSYKVNISNTSNITFTNSNDIYVSDTDLSEALHPYAKTVDVNQQLDKKVTDNKDGTEQLNGVRVQPYNKLSDTIGGRNLIVAKTIENNTTLDGKGNTFGNSPSFTTDYIPVVANQKYTVTIYDTTISCISRFAYYDSSKNFISRETDRNISTSSSEVIVIPSGASYIKFSPDTPDGSGKYEDNYKLEQGSIATDWTPAPEDKVNVSDMRKPASDVAGIEEVNAKQDKIGYTPADDSKVAHLSGTNNFDTVPTVNNNPLLLASSLPPDLARTGQAQTFTQPQTFSIAPTITDASTDKGDNQAATMADLKSVKESAWRQLDPSKISKSGNFEDVLFLYRIDEPNKKVYFSLIVINLYDDTDHSLIFDLSNVISSITEMGSGNMIYYDTYLNHMDAKASFSKSGAKLLVNIPAPASTLASGYQNDCWFGYDTLLI